MINKGIRSRAFVSHWIQNICTPSHRCAVLVVGTSVLLITSTSLGAESDPVPIIFDTDMGNDVDDALALGVIHGLADRAECELLAVTVTKDNDLCAPFIDAVNTFYGRGSIPIGAARSGMTPNDSRFLPLAKAIDNGKVRYPKDIHSSKAVEESTSVLRSVLSAQKDKSVTIVQVGFSRNLANLLNSSADEYSELNGVELVKQKVKMLSAMAGSFQFVDGKRREEFNVLIDVKSARKIVTDWPTPIVFSGVEIGFAILYPQESVKQDFNYVAHHPLAEAYQLYKPTPHERPCWDLTSVLYAVRPDRGYFDISPPGRVRIDEQSYTEFEQHEGGLHRYLKVNAEQIVRIKEALTLLTSQPPVIAASRD